ncbi:MAG: pilus assembly protein [Janthinobacterium lividum]
MNSLPHSLTSRLARRLPTRRGWLWLVAMIPALAVLATFTASSQTAPPAFRSIALAGDPLYATTSGDKPALALALSVEYPTVGAQYTPGGSSDATYANTNEYIGYYDAESCYLYNNTPSETPDTALSQTASDLKRFYRSGAATSRMCADAFSGNFLNWASNSAIDMLRLALSGGDRYIDRTDLTVLQRAVIPNGDPVCMWNSSNFPAKQLTRGGGASGRAYWGAVPLSMATTASSSTSDIWVGNTLDRIYFGMARDGSCSDPTSYRLGAAGPQFFSGTRPAETTSCASEGGTCSFTGTREVWYGANNSWQVGNFTGGTPCTNAVFGDPVPGTAKACYSRSRQSTTTTALNAEGFFYARVQVCDLTSAGALNDNRSYTFCTRYPNGNYKPGGAVQKYSDQLRLAAFGYLLDQTDSSSGGRYGGVLRAPMKYVGNKTFDIYGQDNTPTAGNAKAEWDANTGVYKLNPDTDSMGISGVINYLNKFGRTGTKGRYKIYDPVSELYYETLRYMQGLQPSTLAVSNITDAMKDGFPVFPDWRSPAELDPYAGRSSTGNYACLKSNIVVIGDINTHDGNRYPSTDVANNIPNLNYWTTVVGDFERNTVRTYTDGLNVTRTTGNPNTANSSPRTDAIVGYSYWAHTHDIRSTDWSETARQRPGLRVKTFLFDVNEYGAQNVASTRRNSNQFFTSAKYGGFESDSSGENGKPYNAYGNPFRRQDGTADNNVWQKSTSPGEASTYYLQSSASDVLSAFDKIFSEASTDARSIAGTAITGQKLTQGDNIFQGSFDTRTWSGDLQAFAIATDTTQNVSVSSAASWSASAQLAALPTPNTSRNIVVGNNGATTTTTATAFLWDSIGDDLKAMLNKASPTATVSDGLGKARLDFIRGANSREGTTFRVRNNKLLGDIVNSGVVYSGAPSATVTSSTYAAFRTENLARTPAVFIGANDGMLHAFEAATGNELFGYIPSWVRSKLSLLSGTDYIGNHQSYVDATPAVAEAEVGSAGTQADWRTVLVGGTGPGGRGVFALDVTNPTAFNASKVMWEFTQNDDADMGFVVGRPQILKLRTNASTAATPVYKWFAVVASGVDNYVNDGAGIYSTSGKPALFLIGLTGPTGPTTRRWIKNVDYFKVSFPVNETLAATVAPGMINFEATAGPQREVRYIFAGDLHGNMWKLDFSTGSTDDWNVLKLSPFVKGNTPYPLYIAKNAAGVVQPISMAPTLVAGTRSTSIYVAFGTGKYLETDDRTSSASNSFYVINDNGTATFDDANGVAAVSGRGRLKQGAADTGTGVVSVGTFVWGRATSDGDTTQRSGWYYDYPVAGERQITGAVLSGSVLIFGSLIPGATGGANACGVSGGSGNEYRLGVDDGNGSYRVSRVGILGQPIVVDLAQTIEETSNSTGRRTRTITSQVVRQGSSGIDTGNTDQTKKIIVAGRLSWRQINNYNDLKNSTP